MCGTRVDTASRPPLTPISAGELMASAPTRTRSRSPRETAGVHRGAVPPPSSDIGSTSVPAAIPHRSETTAAGANAPLGRADRKEGDRPERTDGPYLVG